MSTSRYARVSRRTFLRGAALAALAAVSPSAANAATKTTKRTTTTKKKSTTTKAVSTTRATATTAAATTGASAAAGAAAQATGTFAASSELGVAFTFAVTDGGFRVRNPYIAVWIEDPSGWLVRTVTLWYEGGRGRRWLPDLRAWYRADQARLLLDGQDIADSISSPTRLPGSYNVVWDGKATDGTPVPLGEYYVCIEAAREKGPYELIREKITIGTAPFKKTLTPQGELTEAHIELRPRS